LTDMTDPFVEAQHIRAKLAAPRFVCYNANRL